MNLSVIIATMKESHQKTQQKINLLELVKEHIENYKKANIKYWTCGDVTTEILNNVYDTEEKLEILIAGIIECVDINKMYELGFLEDIEE
jgi:hypothetical protein